MPPKGQRANLVWIFFITVLYAQISDAVEYSSYACIYEIVELNCPSGKTVSVTDADYAVYDAVCDPGTCCEPGADDCSVPVEEHRPEDWETIIAECNNRTRCEVEFLGAIGLTDCRSPYEADYMIIYFRCLPEDPTTTQPTSPPTTPPTTEPTTRPTLRPQTTTPADDGGGPPVGAIVGGVVAAVLLIVLIILLVFLIYRLRKKPPPKRAVRIVKRPSNAQRQANQLGRPTSLNQNGNSRPQQANKQQTSPPSNTPVPPYVAYENKGYEQDVEIVMDKNQQAKKSQNADVRVSNGLAGMADIRGNTPTTNAASKNTYENLINETKAQQPSTKARPLSSQNNGNVPQRPTKPPVARVSKVPSTNNEQRPDSKHYDIPKPRKDQKPATNTGHLPGQRHRSDTKSSTGSAQSGQTYENVASERNAPALENKTVPLDEAPPLEKKTIPPDNPYEEVETKKPK